MTMLSRHGTNRHHANFTRKGTRTSTRCAQALATWYSSVQVKNPSVRAILQRCAARRLKRIGQEGRISAKLIKLESKFKLAEFTSTEDAARVDAVGNVDVNSGNKTKGKANANKGSVRAQVPMNKKERKAFKKAANDRMKQLQKERVSKK